MRKSGQSHSVISVTCSSRLYGCCLVTELKLNAPWLLNMCTISCLDELKHDTQALDTSSPLSVWKTLRDWSMDSEEWILGQIGRRWIHQLEPSFLWDGRTYLSAAFGEAFKMGQPHGVEPRYRGPTDTHAHVLMSSIFIYNLWVDQI